MTIKQIVIIMAVNKGDILFCDFGFGAGLMLVRIENRGFGSANLS